MLAAHPCCESAVIARARLRGPLPVSAMEFVAAGAVKTSDEGAESLPLGARQVGMRRAYHLLAAGPRAPASTTGHRVCAHHICCGRVVKLSVPI